MNTTTYGPLHEEPLGLRPPYTVRDPWRAHRVGESTEQWQVRMHADRLAALLDPLDGIELGGHDRRVLDWLAGWDIPTVATIASLLHRTRHTHPRACGGAR
jgi:hypothetical protein